jgi:hypothetical protein
LLGKQMDAMMASVHLSRSTFEAEQLTADVRLRGANDPAVIQSTVAFIDARIGAADKVRAAMAELFKQFDGAQQAIKDRAATARADLAKTPPPPGGGSSGGTSGGKDAGGKDGAGKDADGAKRGGFFNR